MSTPSVLTESPSLDNLADAPFDVKVKALRLLFGFTKREFADILGVNEKTIKRWEDGDSATPQGTHKNAVVALSMMAESLGDLFEPDTIKVWVDRPNPALGGERPRDFVKKPGGIFLIASKLGAVGA